MKKKERKQTLLILKMKERMDITKDLIKTIIKPYYEQLKPTNLISFMKWTNYLKNISCQNSNKKK